MLSNSPGILSNQLTRRKLLEVGSVGALGLNWAHLLNAANEPSKPKPNTFGRAKSCVVIFLFGGPSQQDLWDMKPNAPAEQRGEFDPAATNVPGFIISDQLPHLCRQADKFSILRSVSHKDFEHGSASFTALTGQPHPNPGTNTPAQPTDFPTYGSVVSHVKPTSMPVPDSVVLGPVMHQGSRPPMAGQNGGFLGPAYDPFRIADDPNEATFHVESLRPPKELPRQRLDARRQLLDSIEAERSIANVHRKVAGMTGLYERAFGLLQSTRTQRAFDLAEESAKLRDAYGRTKFGQTLLLARRLVEVQVPLIGINWSKLNADQWDTHKRNYGRLRELLPSFDLGLAAFLEDLQQRGLLETTMVVCLGEFGRTPKMNVDAGRDHWPDCYSMIVTGGGIRPGQIHGASDRFAAYPTESPYAPWDVAATMFHGLGIDPHGHINDATERPFQISRGKVLEGLF